MKTLTVGAESGSYPINIASGLLDKSGDIITKLSKSRRTAIVTDSNVWKLYGGRLTASLDAASISSSVLELPPGEQSKSIDTLARVYHEFYNMRLKRDSLVIAFGGGVMGDLAGYAAASYLRGLDFMQIPTTLLAQVDSSVGGKTAINLPEGKNLVGAFYQPLGVLSDTALLSTLDRRNYLCGMAEVIKHGMLNKTFFSKLEKQPSIDDIVYENCEIKRSFVEGDEHDHGKRMKLNFGHSFGHAIERLGGYEKYNHGEAVALGMKIAIALGIKLGITNPECAERLDSMFLLYGFDIRVDFDINLLTPFMLSDKKNEESLLTLILVRDIGDAIIHKIPYTQFEDMVKKLSEDF